MRLAVLADDSLKSELQAFGLAENIEFYWLHSIEDLQNHQDADAVINLLFENKEEEINFLSGYLPKPVIVNSVLTTLDEINFPFIRINGWPTFLKREIIEAAYLNERTKKAGEIIFTSLGRKTEWVPDITGMISPRIIAMIINEAYFALEDAVSTKEEINTAMKLGTNYPFGPFEWAEKIGLNNILNLLNKLSLKEGRYEPASLLIQDANSK